MVDAQQKLELISIVCTPNMKDQQRSRIIREFERRSNPPDNATIDVNKDRQRLRDLLGGKTWQVPK